MYHANPKTTKTIMASIAAVAGAVSMDAAAPTWLRLLCLAISTGLVTAGFVPRPGDSAVVPEVATIPPDVGGKS